MIKKRFHIKNENGIYLSNIPLIDSEDYKGGLLRDIDFFPKRVNDFSNIFRNCSVKMIDGFNSIIGTNKKPKLDNSILHSEFIKKDSLVFSKLGYTNSFYFYFRFYGSNNIDNDLDQLKVRLYVQIGSNLIPLTISHLSVWDYDINTETYYYIPVIDHPTKDFYFNGFSGISISNNNIWNSFEGEYSVLNGNGIVMGYNDWEDLFEDYIEAPNGYNLRVKCESPTNMKLEGSRDYKLIIEYLNIDGTEPRLSETIVEYVPLELDVLEPEPVIM